jgi:hypothetical protein
MNIPTSAIVPFYIVSFVLLAFQYFRVNPDRRLLNLRFGMMFGAIVLAFVQILMPEPTLSLVLFLLALFWLGLTLFLFRLLPPPRQ